jgi:hypothetical protein
LVTKYYNSGGGTFSLFLACKKREKDLNRLHKKRAQHLREAFAISDQSPLRNRRLRNQIEHFDENLDIFFAKPVAGMFYPKHVGPLPNDDGVSNHVFRAFYTDVGVFEVLGKRYEIQPIIDKIYFIHNKLVEFSLSGYRMSKPEKTDT